MDSVVTYNSIYGLYNILYYLNVLHLLFDNLLSMLHTREHKIHF